MRGRCGWCGAETRSANKGRPTGLSGPGRTRCCRASPGSAPGVVRHDDRLALYGRRQHPPRHRKHPLGPVCSRIGGSARSRDVGSHGTTDQSAVAGTKVRGRDEAQGESGSRARGMATPGDSHPYSLALGAAPSDDSRGCLQLANRLSTSEDRRPAWRLLRPRLRAVRHSQGSARPPRGIWPTTIAEPDAADGANYFDRCHARLASGAAASTSSSIARA